MYESGIVISILLTIYFGGNMFAIISLFLACGDKDNVQDSANEPTDTAETTVTTYATSPFADSSFYLDHRNTTGFTSLISIPTLWTDSEFGFSFYGGCNTYSGEYSLDNDVFSSNELSGTEMDCSSAYTDEDNWLTEFFTSSPDWSFEDNVLVLSNDQASLPFILVTQAPSAPLMDTTWTVKSFVDRDNVTDIDLTNMPTIVFSSPDTEPSGDLTINTGCNQGVGLYFYDTSAIGIGIAFVEYTEEECPDSASQEAEDSIVSLFMHDQLLYTIIGNQLTITFNGRGLIATPEE